MIVCAYFNQLQTYNSQILHLYLDYLIPYTILIALIYLDHDVVGLLFTSGTGVGIRIFLRDTHAQKERNLTLWYMSGLMNPLEASLNSSPIALTIDVTHAVGHCRARGMYLHQKNTFILEL